MSHVLSPLLCRLRATKLRSSITNIPRFHIGSGRLSFQGHKAPGAAGAGLGLEARKHMENTHPERRLGSRPDSPSESGSEEAQLPDVQ